MACVIHFTTTASAERFVLCDAEGLPILFRTCELGWEWFWANLSSLDFTFPPHQNDIHEACINKTQPDIRDDITRVLGTWQMCKTHPGVSIPTRFRSSERPPLLTDT